jgi:REP element-mobilizing transposase RayT
MELEYNCYYHIFNRSNNEEVVFKERGNYSYFLNKYVHYTRNFLDTLAYRLMPTHFHFLVHIKTKEVETVKKNIGLLLSSYTKAINVRHKRHGSLFQHHTKAKIVQYGEYLTTAVMYIHQNPVRSKLVHRLEDWEFSSYRDYIGVRKNSFVRTDDVLSIFSSKEEFVRQSQYSLQSTDGLHMQVSAT